ncbi:tRNA (adenosine(37)-N6)-threonylcarbamoyltransferase complex dimerization subunit type 1 TsaB [PVC group bacterium (ex Bugula neritina AB1)]|nr:tRNA (adenosine(37)-N6)-threonylcarbamoyltransferase complex dimerization subunit type 1 TsaB [PVC group bacterium (ex Bugula neritina AB1)]
MSECPNVLVADTHGQSLMLALQKGENERVFWQSSSRLSHSKELLPAIKNILEKNSLTLKDVDIWGVVTGPGSYTGLRIGLMAIRTLAHLSKKPCYGLSSLESLYKEVVSEQPVLSLIPVSKTHVYAQLFDPSQKDFLQKDPIYAPLDEVLEWVTSEATIVEIQGRFSFESQIHHFFDEKKISITYLKKDHLSGDTLLDCVSSFLTKKEDFPLISEVKPLYLS